MATADRQHWDDRYRDAGPAEPVLPARFEPFLSPPDGIGTALELACGFGQASVWLAIQGVETSAYDISPVAIAAATELADQHGVAGRCSFAVADFDEGLPDTDQVDLILCNLFRDARLDQVVMDRLRPGGILAVAALSEVGAAPGRFRVAPAELNTAFAALDPVASDESGGVAWLVARKRS